MGAIVERCCGLDVHQASVIACLLIGTAGKKPVKVIKTFSAMTSIMLPKNWTKE